MKQILAFLLASAVACAIGFSSSQQAAGAIYIERYLQTSRYDCAADTRGAVLSE